MIDPDALVERYVAVWNEANPTRRRRRVADLWHETAVRYNHTGEQIGREAISEAVISTYRRFGANGYRFRAANDTGGHHNAVKFGWAMIDPNGETDSIGTTFLLLDESGRIKLDYQFTGVARVAS